MASDKARAEWIAKMLSETGKSQKGLARALGLDQSQGNRIVKGSRALRAAEIPLIERYIGVRMPDDLEGECELKPFAPDGYVSIPVYDLRAAAGAGAVAVDATPIDYEMVREGMLRRLARDISRLFILEVSGDSGWPNLHNGDLALVDTEQNDPRREGRYVIRLDDVLQVKLLSMHPVTKRLTVKSDNPDYPSFNDILPDEIVIVGRVIRIIRNLI